MLHKNTLFPIVTLFLFTACETTGTPTMNGFDLSESIIPIEEIHRGGPPRDGIPSIDDPVFIRPEEATFLQDDDLVISFSHDGETRAYPLRILVWHEIVNDRIGDLYFNVTYCPLCGTSMIFDSSFDGEVLDFGVSGLLYRSDVLMYDRTTESLWSQLGMKAVTGPYKGTEMILLASGHMTWERWKKEYPDGRVLSTDTGHRRNYRSSPYEDYERHEGVMFPVPKFRDELNNKDWVVGVIVDGHAMAYPVENLEKHPVVEQEVGDNVLRIHYDAEARKPEVVDARTGETIPYILAYWFAWQGFYPDTGLWEP